MCEPRVPNPAEPPTALPRSTRQVGGDYEFIMSLMHDEFFHSAKEKTARCADAAERSLANPGAHDVQAESMKIIAFEAPAMKGSALTLCAKASAQCARLELVANGRCPIRAPLARTTCTGWSRTSAPSSTTRLRRRD